MLPARTVIAVLLLLAGACAPRASLPAGPGPSPEGSPSATPAPTPAPSPSPSPGPVDEPFAPAADRPIPRRPARLARALRRTHTELFAAIRAWRRQGDPRTGPAPRRVILLGLYRQRIYRLLARKPELERALARRLPGWLAADLHANAAAGRSLRALVDPVEPRAARRFRTGRALPAGELLGYYRKAERRFGVDWEVLAAINLVETKFNRIRSSSSAGAQGPMQFIPSTWEAYGMGGDVHDPHDAILGAANYLRASGAPGDYPRALYAYNHSWDYVDAIVRYARQMRHDADYFAYYTWQVFVATTKGDLRLTGPEPGRWDH